MIVEKTKRCGRCKWWKMQPRIFLDGKYVDYTDATSQVERMGKCLHKPPGIETVPEWFKKSPEDFPRHAWSKCKYFEILEGKR